MENNQIVEEKPKREKDAWNSAAFGLIGIPFCCLGFLFGPLAIMLGIRALGKIKKSQGILKGKLLAMYGIILGSISIMLFLYIFILEIIHIPKSLRASKIRNRVSRVKAEEHYLVTSLESYYIDNSCYPPPDYDRDGTPVFTHRMTTPIVYLPGVVQDSSYSNLTRTYRYFTLPGLLHDPFNVNTNGYYRYYTDGQNYFLSSYGPDSVDGNSGIRGGTKIDYTKALSDEKLGVILQWSGLTYDPTNGTTSPGDIWRSGPYDRINIGKSQNN